MWGLVGHDRNINEDHGVPWGRHWARGVLIAVLSWTAVAGAGTVLSEEERRGMRDLIVSAQAKISSLWVEFHTIQHENTGEARERHYEWAFSGARRYRKSWWPTPVGSPLPERWGLAVWDGKFKKAYDSELHNGSLRDKDNWKADEPQTSSPYSRCLGDYSQGTMTDIFSGVPPANWEAQWSDDKQTVTFTTDAFPTPDSPEKCSWTFDTTKGYMIARSEIMRKGADGQWLPYASFAVTESQEVSPGIWLALKTHHEGLFRIRGEDIHTYEDILVDGVKINDPGIESVFHFEWPAGSKYHDYILGRTVVPHTSLGAAEEALDTVAQQLTPGVPRSPLAAGSGRTPVRHIAFWTLGVIGLGVLALWTARRWVRGSQRKQLR